MFRRSSRMYVIIGRAFRDALGGRINSGIYSPIHSGVDDFY